MPVEKYSTLQPQKSPKRIVKGKLLTALGATGVLLPYPQNTERLIERKILLQNPFGGIIGPSNPLTLDWVNRVMINGGATPSVNTITALTTFEIAIKTIKSQIVQCNFFAADSIIACKTPFLVGPGPDPWPTVTPGFDPRRGLNGWGLGFSGDAQITNIFTPSTSGLNFLSMGLVLYCYVWADGQTTQDIGAYRSATNDGFYIENMTNNRYTQIGQVLITAAGVGLNGYHSSQRRSTTDFQFYFANSTNVHASIGSSAVVETGSIANVNFPATIGMSTDGALPVFPPTNRIWSFYALTTGLSGADDTTLYTAVQALRTSLGGGFV
jgi:hypothetical protein